MLFISQHNSEIWISKIPASDIAKPSNESDPTTTVYHKDYRKTILIKVIREIELILEEEDILDGNDHMSSLRQLLEYPSIKKEPFEHYFKMSISNANTQNIFYRISSTSTPTMPPKLALLSFIFNLSVPLIDTWKMLYHLTRKPPLFPFCPSPLWLQWPSYDIKRSNNKPLINQSSTKIHQLATILIPTLQIIIRNNRRMMPTMNNSAQHSNIWMVSVQQTNQINQLRLHQINNPHKYLSPKILFLVNRIMNMKKNKLPRWQSTLHGILISKLHTFPLCTMLGGANGFWF